MNRPALSLILVAACTGAEQEEMSGEITAATMAQAVCARQSECCPGNEESEQECRSSLAGVLAPIFELPGIEIDPAAAEACLSAVRGMSCDDVASHAGKPPVLLVCEPFHRGTLPLDAACGGSSILERLFDDDRCESGACASGRCAPPREAGESCSEAPCRAGLTCSLGVCVAPKGRGEDCSEQGICGESDGCVGEPLTCQELEIVAVGEQCGAGRRCELGEDRCFCPVGQEGCAVGICGNRSRCVGRE